jgi:hypothetical protein
VHGAASRRRVHQRRVLRAVGLGGAPLLDGPAGGQVAVQEVVRRSLVGDQIRPDAAGLGAPDEFRHHFGSVAEQADRHRLLLGRVFRDPCQGIVEVRRLFVQVARAQAEVDAALLALDVERHRARKGGGQRLRAAHAAQAGGEDPLSGKAAGVVLAAGFGEGFVGALHDALAADVDPRAGRHLPVHHQALAVELVEVLPGGPLRHQVRVGDQHARRVGMGAQDRDRLAGLHQQRLVLGELAQRLQDRLEAVPVARRLADAAVDHQCVGVLGHLGIEVVLDHPVGGLDLPVAARERGSARGAHRARAGDVRGGKVGHRRFLSLGGRMGKLYLSRQPQSRAGAAARVAFPRDAPARCALV